MIPAAISTGIGRRMLAARMHRSLRLVSANILASVVLGGCAMQGYSPTLSVSGSFFPVWLIAALLGSGCAVVLRLLFIRMGLQEHLPVPPLTYLSAAIFSGIMIWLLWTGGIAL